MLTPRGEELASALAGEHDIQPVGRVTFVVRAELDGVVRFVRERELEADHDARLSGASSLRGSFIVSGPPTHTLGDLFFCDLATAAGSLWRAVGHLTEPGTAMDLPVADQHLTLRLEHRERALTAVVFGAKGVVHLSRAYDPFAFIEGTASACERLERLLRTRGLRDAAQAITRAYAKPAFPQMLPM